MADKIDRILQKDVLAAMLKNPKLTFKLRKIVSPNMFSLRSYRFCCKNIFNYLESSEELPSEDLIKIIINKNIKDDDKKKEFRKKILPLFHREVKSSKGLLKEVGEWAEKQTFALMLEEAARLGSEGNLEKGKEVIRSSFLFDVARADFETHSVLESWKERQRKRKKDSRKGRQLQIRTELGPFDQFMKIMKNQSSLITLMGTSGVGKSIFSINYGIYGLNSNCNVAHFVFENTAWQTLTRYDTRLIKFPYNMVRDFNWKKKDLVRANALMRKLKRKRNKQLKVIHAPMDTVSIVDIEGILRDIEITEGWVPEFIVYDSLDHVLSTKKHESYRLDVKGVFTDTKRQSELRNIPILSTTHAKASAKGTRLRQESFSESYDKSRLSDGVITISQTQEQEDDRQAIITVDKWRDDEGKISILVELLFHLMTIRFIERISVGGGDDE